MTTLEALTELLSHDRDLLVLDDEGGLISEEAYWRLVLLRDHFQRIADRVTADADETSYDLASSDLVAGFTYEEAKQLMVLAATADYTPELTSAVRTLATGLQKGGAL